ncbi:MAG TPA: hypothetical protein VHA75_00305, partial [Rugosimonospora sp.]|nr:hypothetical protein [Rugosimonospora sp.]
AASRGVPLVVAADGRTGRRLAPVLAELASHGVTATLVKPEEPSGDGALVVAADGAAVTRANLLVRERPDTELAEPSVWVPLLPRTPAAPDVAAPA